MASFSWPKAELSKAKSESFKGCADKNLDIEFTFPLSTLRWQYLIDSEKALTKSGFFEIRMNLSSLKPKLLDVKPKVWHRSWIKARSTLDRLPGGKDFSEMWMLQITANNCKTWNYPWASHLLWTTLTLFLLKVWKTPQVKVNHFWPLIFLCWKSSDSFLFISEKCDVFVFIFRYFCHLCKGKYKVRAII